MSRFAFRANAAALGGVFTRPFNEPLQVQAATSLPPGGGYGAARVEHFRFRELVSFSAAYTQVIGTEFDDDGTPARTTLSAAVIENLNILDMVTADRVVGRLASESIWDGPANEPGWLPLGSYFVNLRIAGVPVDVQIHPVLLRDSAATLSATKASGVEKLFNPDDGAALQGDRIRCSMFEPLPTTKKIPGSTVNKGCRIRIPGFGDVYLGEYVITRDRRQLTMVRVEMQSPTEGSLSVDYLEGNGSDF